MARRFEDGGAMGRVLKDIACRDELMRAAVGPMTDFKFVRGLSSSLQNMIQRMQDLSAVFDMQFRLPKVLEPVKLMQQMHTGTVPSFVQRMNDLSAIETAMSAMHSPWLHEHNALRSVTGFAELQGIGHALASMPAFDRTLTSALRTDLGDWRDSITWPNEIFTDFAVRSEFYVGRGLNTALTDFPAAAFRESVEIAGLRRPPPAVVGQYGRPVPASDDPDEEEGLARTNEAHDWLQRFETRLRKFIDDRMSAAFGPDWPRHRLPNGLYEKWHDKKRREEQETGRVWPLIAYADFTDYALVICRGDNWKTVFKRTFGREESVRESLQRLYPIRICTMHARPITQDDELFLYVELRRLIGVIE
jgi:hypothetical protein